LWIDVWEDGSAMAANERVEEMFVMDLSMYTSLLLLLLLGSLLEDSCCLLSCKMVPRSVCCETHKKKGQFGDFHHNCKQPCNEMILQRMAFEAFDPEIWW